jgi:hypothetical protein
MSPRAVSVAAVIEYFVVVIAEISMGFVDLQTCAH